MPRVSVEYRTASKEVYYNFCKKNSTIELTFDEWRNIIYAFNEALREYLLETGERIKLPFGLGEVAIIKKKRKKTKIIDGKEYINLAVDWQKTRAKGKIIYNFNNHTEGFFFGWYWFKTTARFKHSSLWFFKATRTTSRLLSHYIKSDNKYQHIYCEWKPYKYV